MIGKYNLTGIFFILFEVEVFRNTAVSIHLFFQSSGFIILIALLTAILFYHSYFAVCFPIKIGSLLAKSIRFLYQSAACIISILRLVSHPVCFLYASAIFIILRFFSCSVLFLSYGSSGFIMHISGYHACLVLIRYLPFPLRITKCNLPAVWKRLVYNSLFLIIPVLYHTDAPFIRYRFDSAVFSIGIVRFISFTVCYRNKLLSFIRITNLSASMIRHSNESSLFIICEMKGFVSLIAYLYQLFFFIGKKNLLIFRDLFL